ncbi:hypothetical protein GCM10023238_00320 [Streptomyces heliomycini]
MDPAVRSSRAEVVRLPDPEFTEVGASGRRYTYEETLAELCRPPGRPGCTNRRRSPASSSHPARCTSRTRPASTVTGPAAAPSGASTTTGGDRRMYYHQGTPVP